MTSPIVTEIKELTRHDKVLQQKLLEKIETLTERVEQSEQRYRDLENYWEVTFNSIPDIIMLVDKDYRLTKINKAAEKRLGLSNEQAVGRYCYEVFHGKHAPPSCCPHTLACQDMQEHTHEIFEEGLDGHFTFSSTPLKDSNGLVYGMVEVARDITDKKRAEAALLEGRQRLDAMNNSALDAIIVINGRGEITFFNKSAENIFWYRADEVLGKRLHDILVSEDARKKYEQQLPEFEKSGECPVMGKHIEGMATRKDGLRFPVEISVSSYFLNGQWFSTASLRDISERKKTEEALRISEERFKGAFRYSATGMALLTPDGNFLEVNPPLCEFLGYEKEELKKLSTRDITFSEDLEPYLAKLEQVRSGKISSLSMENRYHHKNGKTVWGRLSLSFVRDEEGVPVVFVAQVQDTTSLKEGEQKLRKANSELARSNNELEQFAYLASHDLKEPLRTVSMLSRMLDDDYKERLDENGKEFLTLISAATDRMTQLINDLLDFSRVGMEHVTNSEVVNISDLVTLTLQNLKTSIDDSKTLISYEGLPEVAGSSKLLARVFQNLISNAIKFRSENPPEITLACIETGSNWLFTVTDNGIGVRAGDREKIFGLFERIHTDEKISGTGIGLAICKKIVKLHGGHIGVEAGETGGATFFFTLKK